jgi:phosphoglycolate phosphatase
LSIIDRYSAILFDLDGTLVDSWLGVKDAYIEGFRHFYPKGKIEHIDKLRNDGRPYEDAIRFVMQTQRYHEEAEKKIGEIYIRDLTKKSRLFDGVMYVLQTLNSKYKPWGIVTTKRRNFVAKLIENFSCLNTRVQICAEDVEEKKPSPEGLVKAADQLNVPVSSILYVGDLESDIMAAKQAGCDSALMLYGYNINLEAMLMWRPTFYLNNLQELLV